MRSLIFCIVCMAFISPTMSQELVARIKQIKPAVVAIGVYTPTGRPQNQVFGSGFVIGDGTYVATNYHVLPEMLDQSINQQHVVFSGQGKQVKTFLASVVGYSKQHDLAILKLTQGQLPTVKLADQHYIDEGREIAFTGFPIASVLGLYPVTHRGIIASVTPTISPVADSRQINTHMLKQLRNPYLVYQLDATAYPGNSGSALYRIDSGEVVGIINKVFVQQSKEGVISNPSGITYAIPVKHLHELMKKHQIQ
ncbi:trypsin-like peptidase domain-containing protein [Thalassotalea sp. LPB0316]|uniref:S1 family peptidase n=1 Tax=Thalassotalea sp. LPB0316 TaxID=2769490 RepID=UPI0018694A38|nr:serine protease [Thalassotalea sp. LPB0316]QOL26511.1 trypsin-like peptidase domain-containing protein [Thalassotalea sp. LPB0316]